MLLLILGLQSFAHAQQKTHLSSDPRVNSARELIDAGKNMEALKILRTVASDRSDTTDVNFLIGLAASRASQRVDAEDDKDALLKEAAEAFYKILVVRPELVRVRLEFARVLFLQGEDDLSKTQFERVLSGDVPAAVVVNVNIFLQAIQQRRRWSGYFGFAIAPNTNLNSAANRTRIITVYCFNIFGVFRCQPVYPTTRRAKSGIGAIWSVGGEYQLPIKPRLKMLFGTDFQRIDYASEEYDSTALSAHFGPKFKLDKVTEFSIQPNIRQQWNAGHRYSFDVGARFNISRHMSRKWKIYSNASLLHRTFANSNGNNDGLRINYGLSASYLFKPTLQFSYGVGWNWSIPKDIRGYTRGHSLQFGMTTALPLGFTVGTSINLSKTKAPFRTTILGVPQVTSRSRTIRVSVLNRAFTIFGISPQLALVQNIFNDEFRDVKRYSSELQFVRQF